MTYDLTVPSFWQDEAATLSGANRPISTLLKMAQKIDVVHSFYYGLMHFWSSAFGFSVLSMRIPSILAVGATCSLIYVLVRKLNGTYPLAILASSLYLVLPRTHYASGESRSNALTATLAVALTLALVILLNLPTKSLPVWLSWLGYAALATLSTYDFMFSLLLAVPHLVYVMIRHREKLWYFLASWGVALIAAAPLFYWGYKEKNQVSWIKLKPITSYLFESVVSVNFLSRYWIAGIFLGLGVLVAIAYVRSRLQRQHFHENTLVEMSLLWVALPSATLIAASFAFHPYFVEHYLTFTTPATAILGAVGLSKLKFNWLMIPATVAIFALGFFSLQDARAAWAHGPSWMPVIQDVAANTKSGDGILLPDWRTRNSAEIQLMLDSYRIGYLPGRVDLTLTEPPSISDKLFGFHVKEKDAPQPSSLMSRVALVSDVIDPVPAMAQAPAWIEKNYTITAVRQFKDAIVTYFTRKHL